MAVFDTQAYVQRLRKGGVVAKQAGAHSEGLHEALKEGVATNAQLQTVEMNLVSLDVRMTALQREVQLNRWLIVFLMALVTLLDLF